MTTTGSLSPQEYTVQGVQLCWQQQFASQDMIQVADTAALGNSMPREDRTRERVESSIACYGLRAFQTHMQVRKAWQVFKLTTIP